MKERLGLCSISINHCLFNKTEHHSALVHVRYLKSLDATVLTGTCCPLLLNCKHFTQKSRWFVLHANNLQLPIVLTLETRRMGHHSSTLSKTK